MPLVRKDTSPLGDGSRGVDLASVDPEERWQAARALTGDGAVTAITAALEHEAVARVREALFTALARVDTPEAADVALAYLRSDDAAQRTLALDCLRAMARAGPQKIGAALNDPDPDVRLLACEMARDLSAEDATRFLAALLLHEPQVNVCASAIDVLAEVGDGGALDALEAVAARFEDQFFLQFSAQVAMDRIRSSNR